MELAPHKTCLLIVDMQKFFLDYLKTEEKEGLISSNSEIIRTYPGINPVIFLEYQGKGETIIHLLNSVQQKIIVVKNEDDGFFETNLDKELTKRNIKNLVVGGMGASACVRKTVHSALKKGYNVLTSPELVKDISRVEGLYGKDQHCKHQEIFYLPLKRLKEWLSFYGQQNQEEMVWRE